MPKLTPDPATMTDSGFVGPGVSAARQGDPDPKPPTIKTAVKRKRKCFMSSPVSYPYLFGRNAFSGYLFYLMKKKEVQPKSMGGINPNGSI
jgi:hypothetical protein